MINAGQYILELNTRPIDSTDSPNIMATNLKKTKVKFSNGRPQKLGPNYTPGQWDVMCARGKAAYNHPGNKKLRSLIKQYQNAFGQAKSRVERIIVVTNIVDAVRAKGIGFIKQDETDGQWCEVGDRLSREKVGQLLRDSQGSRYKSSTKFKRQRREGCRATIQQNMHNVVKSNPIVRMTLAQVNEHVTHCIYTDEQLLCLLNHANNRMLEALKQDSTLLRRFTNARHPDDDLSESSSYDESTGVPMME